MTFQKALVAAGLAAMALHANAVVFTETAATPADAGMIYVAPSFTGTGSVGTTTIPNVQTDPLYDTGSFLVVDPGASASIDLGTGGTFTFLWGSPDATNVFTIDGVDYTGASLIGGLANSDNANSQLVTVTGFADGDTLTLSTNQIALEVAVAAPVPEPETYALMLGGLGALAFVARRRKA